MNTSLVLLILVWCGILNYHLSVALTSCKGKNTGKSKTKTKHHNSKIFSPSTAARSSPQLAAGPVFYGYPNAGSPFFYQTGAGSDPYYAAYMGSGVNGFPYAVTPFGPSTYPGAGLVSSPSNGAGYGPSPFSSAALYPYPGINQGSLGAGTFYFYPDAAPTLIQVPAFNGGAPHVKGNKDKRNRHNGCYRSKKTNRQETIHKMKQTDERSSPEKDSQR